MTAEAPAPVLAPWQAFFDNRNFVAGTVRIRSAGPDRGRDDDVTEGNAEAVSALGDAIRAAGYDNTPGGGPLARLALGFTVDRHDLVAAIPDDVVGGLSACGLAIAVGPALRLRGTILAAGRLLAYVPRDGARSDSVYVGPDSAFLVDAVGRIGAAVSAGRAADLGTGTGVVAAALPSRHPLVVASDVSARSARAARLTAALNRFPPGHRMEACLADVARGLRRGTFDLVAANTPWVPSGGGSERRIFADGGPTGFELPRRFLVEGSRLLRPGGVMIALAADVTFASRRSPLRDLCACSTPRASRRRWCRPVSTEAVGSWRTACCPGWTGRSAPSTSPWSSPAAPSLPACSPP